MSCKKCQQAGKNHSSSREITDKFRENASVTHGVRVIAKITHDLNQTLLLCGGLQSTSRTASQKSLACEPQNCIVFRRRPGVETMLYRILEICVSALNRACPEPGQDHVHGQVGNARRAQKRLRFF
jgi:hypothetical protein